MHVHVYMSIYERMDFVLKFQPKNAQPVCCTEPVSYPLDEYEPGKIIRLSTGLYFLVNYGQPVKSMSIVHLN
mgnify:CR=1 FL=1